MIFPAITAFYAAVLALIYVGLTVWVVAGRMTSDTLQGEGDGGLARRIRSHGNFAEFVPFALLLIALLEAGGASSTLVRTLLIILVVARLLHPVGLFAPKNAPRQFICRGGGALSTYAVMIVTAVALLLR